MLFNLVSVAYLVKVFFFFSLSDSTTNRDNASIPIGISRGFFLSNIVGCLAVGAFMAIVLTLTVVPAVLVALDRWVVYGKKNRFNGEVKSDSKE